jgi:L-alanine-DL-glutamate epimerase-like enolase superfamily enzyme
VGRIDRIDVSAYTVPTDAPEADGTYAWDSTTIVIVEAVSGDVRSLGYGYADVATAKLADRLLAPKLIGRDPMSVPASWIEMVNAIRNLGRPGICSMAIAAIDAALWDLKARLLNLPLVTLLGAARESAIAYGSGGFTSYSDEQLRLQLGGWASEGLKAVKMKIGTHPGLDLGRVKAAREAIGEEVELFVDANGAYDRKQALLKAHQFADCNVTWFEEPVSSDDLDGLRLIRDHAPPGMRIAAGEYGYDERYFRRMAHAGAVDVLQADATRCAGVTGFRNADAICEAFCRPLSAHTAPTLHTPLCCAALRAINVEYFHDHARIELMFFDGAIRPVNGELRPDLSRPGLGLKLRKADAERYRVYGNNADS